MVMYIATIISRSGHEAEVSEHYKKLEPQLAAAKGFQGRQIFRAMPGTMAEAIRKLLPPEETAKHPESGTEGTHFIIVEQWNSVDERVAFSMGAGRSKDLIQHLHPAHTHEFYESL